MATLYRNALRTITPKNLNRCNKVIFHPYSKLTDTPTAGIIIIGDEILKAQVKDTNSHYMCNLLFNCGVRVKKISVVSDQVSHIAEEIQNFSNKYTYVITSGGIGPTHDDVTFEALAAAFDDSMHHHPALVNVIKNHFAIDDFSSPGYKLAYIPEKAALKFGRNQETGEPLIYPCINMKNVYVFPGSPHFLEKSFGNMYKELFSGSKNFITKNLYIDAKEEVFANALSVVSKEFPHVSFGSYPHACHSFYKVRVTIESDDIKESQKAIKRFQDLAPPKILVDYDASPLVDSTMKYQQFIRSCRYRSIFEGAMKSLKELYSDSKTVAICFDGSIESTILLHLAHIAGNQLREKDRLQAVYFKRPKPFPDVETFIKETTERYNISLHILEGPPQKALKELASLKPELRTLLLGLKADKVDTGVWHQLAKDGTFGNIQLKCPILDWTYKNIWTFARSLSLSYCPLYDKGYTSIGNQSDTEPNPNLMIAKSIGPHSYFPAHMLTDSHMERAGRITKGTAINNFKRTQII